MIIYLAESVPNNKRGLITSFAAIGANLGFLTSSFMLIIMTYLFNEEMLSRWAWRMPFLLVGVFGSIISYYRFKLTETRTFSSLKKNHHLEKKPLRTAFQCAPMQMLKIFGLTCMSSSLYYIFFGYMPTYLNLYMHIDRKLAFGIQTFFLIMMMLLVPFAGYCGDKIGRKYILMLTAISTIFLSIPCFLLLQNKTLTAILISLFIATILSSYDQGNSLSAVVENCPANIRYSGLAFSYNLGMAIFGGTAPIIVTLLTSNISIISPAIYLIMMSIISLIAASSLLKKSNMNTYLDYSE